MATDVIARLLYLQHQDARQPLSLCIESPGGAFSAGMAIIDTVRSLAPPVRTEAPPSLTASRPSSWPPVAGVSECVGPAAKLSLVPVWSPDPETSAAELDRTRHELIGVIADLSGRPEEVVHERPLGRAAPSRRTRRLSMGWRIASACHRTRANSAARWTLPGPRALTTAEVGWRPAIRRGVPQGLDVF